MIIPSVSVSVSFDRNRGTVLASLLSPIASLCGDGTAATPHGSALDSCGGELTRANLTPLTVHIGRRKESRSGPYVKQLLGPARQESAGTTHHVSTHTCRIYLYGKIKSAPCGKRPALRAAYRPRSAGHTAGGGMLGTMRSCK